MGNTKTEKEKQRLEEAKQEKRIKDYKNRQTCTILETKPKHYRFISFDVETIGRNNDFYICGILDYNGEYKTYYDIEEVIDYFKRIKHNDIMIVATNLEFDFSVIFKKSLMINQCEFIVNSGHFIMVTMKGTYNKIKFYDTLNFGGFSVETMGKILGKPKLKHPSCLGKKPKNKKEELELVEYNKRDCEVSQDFMIMLQEAINKEGGELKPTVSSCALDIYRRRFMPFNMIREEIWNGIKVKDKVHKAYYGGRTEAFKRGKITDYNYYDVNCFSEDTEILTDKGFKKFNEIKSMDKCFGMNGEKLIKQKIKKLFVYNYNGKMINLENENTSQLVTPEHRVIYKGYNRCKLCREGNKYKSWSEWKIKKAIDIPKTYIKFPNAKIYNGKKEINENILRICAWYITEGHINKYGVIEISQSLSVNPEKCKIIKKLFKDVGIKYKIKIRNQKDKEYIYIHFRKEYIEKYFDNILQKNSYNMTLIKNFQELTYEQKTIFFKELMLGDGSYSKGKTTYVSYSNKLLDELQILCTMIGYKCFINYKNHVANIKLNRNGDSHIKSKKEIRYKGIVWCISTWTKNLVVRRKGKIFISGNSLYPFVMLNKYPVPQTVFYVSSSTKDVDIKFYLQFEGVSYFKLNIPYTKYPLLPYRYNKRLVFPVGKFAGYYTHVEIRRAIELYGENIIIEMKDCTYYTDTFPVFKNYVDFMYKKRLEAKEQKSSFEVFYKLMMNSLYGKFAMKNITNTEYFIPETNEDVLFNIKRGSDKANISVNMGELSYINNPREYDGIFSFPIWSCYVTAYARILMHKYICESEPVYIDTDSLFTTKEIKSGKLLGELKLECVIKHGIIIKPKAYYINESVKFKGLRIPKDQKHVDRLFKNVLLQKPIRYEKFVKIKEGIKRKMNINSIIVVEKHVDLEDIKRNWKDKKFNPLEIQDSEPLVLNEF